MSHKKQVKQMRTWTNWSTVEELSIEWNVSKRRVQQILQEYSDLNMLQQGVISYTERVIAKMIAGYDKVVITTKPVYRMDIE